VVCRVRVRVRATGRLRLLLVRRIQKLPAGLRGAPAPERLPARQRRIAMDSLERQECTHQACGLRVHYPTHTHRAVRERRRVLAGRRRRAR